MKKLEVSLINEKQKIELIFQINIWELREMALVDSEGNRRPPSWITFYDFNSFIFCQKFL